jgi:hypothetical protein
MDGSAGPPTLSITEEAISSDKSQATGCPLLAQSGHFETEFQCPLLGGKADICDAGNRLPIDYLLFF